MCVHLGRLKAEGALARAQPAWHTLSSGKSTLLCTEQVGEEARHFRALYSCKRRNSPPEDRRCFESDSSLN